MLNMKKWDSSKQFSSESQPLTLKERNQLLIDYAPLVSVIARKIASRLPACVELDDLISTGFLGLMEAIEKFDPSKDVQFKTYGEWRIRGAILDELRQLDVVPRSVRDKIKKHERTIQKLEHEIGRPAEFHEKAAAMNLSSDEYKSFSSENFSPISISLSSFQNSSVPFEVELSGDFIESIETSLLQNELYGVVKDAIETLPKQQAQVMRLYFYDGRTLKECAQELQISESRVSQIRTMALRRLKKRLTSQDFLM